MARALRIQFNNAWYHVMNRGASGRDIFHNEFHRKIFYKILSDASEIYDIQIHGFCLMGNHYHLLIKTPQANLSQAMHYINGVYVQKYNWSVGGDGPLFRGRYKAIIVDKDSYLLQVSRYIHLNPHNAHIEEKIGDYTWSSYRAYIGKEPTPKWLYKQELLSYFSRNNPNASYKDFVSEGVDKETKEFYRNIKNVVVLGKKSFKKMVLSKIKHEVTSEELAQYNTIQPRPTLDEIITACSKVYEISNSDICTHVNRRGFEARELCIYICRKWSGQSVHNISLKFNFYNKSSVSKVVKKIDNNLLTFIKLKEVLLEIGVVS